VFLIEGTTALEAMWGRYAPSKEWTELKKVVGESLVQDVCLALGRRWPIEVGQNDEVGHNLLILLKALTTHKTVRGVYDVPCRREQGQPRTRREGHFKIVLTFGGPSLAAESAVGYLDRPLRAAQGLPVSGSAAPAAREPVERPLKMYMEKTPAQKRKRAERDGEGADDGGGKGKGKGRGRGRRGRGGAAAASRAARAAQAAGPPAAAAAAAPAVGAEAAPAAPSA
jgi:hypothetical protein